MILAHTHPEYPSFCGIQQSVESRAKDLGKANEKSTIQKPLNQAINVLAPIMVPLTPQDLQNPKLKEKVSEALHFLDNLQTILTKERNKQIPLNITEIYSLVCYISKRYQIETGRAFKKYHQTRILSLALYYDSWWPFIENSTVNKSAREITLDIPEGTEIKLMSGEKIKLPERLYAVFSIDPEEQQTNNNAQPIVPQPNAQPSVPQPNVGQINGPTIINGISFDFFNSSDIYDDSFEALWI